MTDRDATTKGSAAAGDAGAAADVTVADVTGERAPERVRIPGWLPPVLYGVVTLLLFREFVFGDAMLFGSDTEGLGYMARAFYADRLAQGDFPLWNPLLLGGTPFLASLAGGDSLYPPSALLLLLLEPYRALGWKLVLHVFAAGLFTFGWCRVLGRSRAAALLAGLAYMVAPFFVTLVWPGHDGKLFVTALTPLLFWAVEAWFARRGLAALAGIGAVVALVILTTHFQMAYFLFGAVGAYALFRTVQEGRRAGRGWTGAAGPFWVFLGASVVGAAAAGVQLLPAVDYIGDFSRRTATTTTASPEQNRVYASSWSMHPEEAFAAVAVPEFVGSTVGGADWTSGTYWGRNAFKLNHEYLGLGALLLALLGLMGGVRRGLLRFFGALGAVAFLYTLGTHTPVWGVFYALLPGIDLFRAPSMVIFLAGFSAVTLMAFGVDRALGWVEGEDEEGARTGMRTLWIVTGLLALGMLLASGGAFVDLWTGVVHTDLPADKAQALERLRPFLGRGFLAATFLAGALATTFLVGRRGLLKPSGVVAILALLLTLDGLRVDAPFITTRDFEAFAAPDPNARFLMERQAQDPPFRVLDLDGSGQAVDLAMHGIELAAGHHPNDLASYRELIGMAGSDLPYNLIQMPRVARLLNVRYLVWPAYQFGDIEGQGVAVAAGARVASATRLQGGQVYEVVYELREPFARARLVGEARVVPESETLDATLDPALDPATTAVLSSEPPLELGGAGVQGSVEWVESTPDRAVLRVTTDRNALLVVSQNWYPGWTATVDDAEVPVLPAYHTLQAVPVEAGEHTVVLEVRATGPLKAGLWLTLVAWVLIVGLASYALSRKRGARAG